jgi:hypothetical protein
LGRRWALPDFCLAFRTGIGRGNRYGPKACLQEN